MFTAQHRLLLSILPIAVAVGVPAGDAPTPRVEVVRVPQGGLQPDVVVDADGTIHLVYLSGDPAAADVYYTNSTDAGGTFVPPVRVNSQQGSAVALGTIRGAQLAVGADGRRHVVWNGSASARPTPPVREGQRPGMPLLYSRSTPDGTRFELQRTLQTSTRHLDGGASVAADASGGVYVVWHANALDGPEGEQARRVYLARSTDAGASFASERPISPAETGACGCCGVRAAAGPSGLHVLYRSARALVHRDIKALHSLDRGDTFDITTIDTWQVGTCPMSSMAILPGVPPVYAWEHDGVVAYAEAGTGGPVMPTPPPGDDASSRRKHPRLARAPDGAILLAWATGTGWNRGGGIAWQVFTQGRPQTPVATRDGLPVWSAPAVAASGNRFLVFF